MSLSFNIAHSNIYQGLVKVTLYTRALNEIVHTGSLFELVTYKILVNLGVCEAEADKFSK